MYSWPLVSIHCAIKKAWIDTSTSRASMACTERFFKFYNIWVSHSSADGESGVKGCHTVWQGVTFKEYWIFSSLLLYQFTWMGWARSHASHIKQRIASLRMCILSSMFRIWSNGVVHSTAGFNGSWSPLPCSHQPAVGPVMSHINPLHIFLSISSKSILILSSLLQLHFLSGLFLSGFKTNIFMHV